MLQGIPDTKREAEIKELKNSQVKEIHDFRMWSIDDEHSVLSVHIVVTEIMSLKEAERLKERIKSELAQLHVTHATIEVEHDPEH